jgi:DNA-binding XRE family transcriptional regulator
MYISILQNALVVLSKISILPKPHSYWYVVAMTRAKNKYHHRLKIYRRRMGFNQREVADRLGLADTSLISRWESGAANLSLENALRLSKLYKTLVNELVYELDRDIGKELFPLEQIQGRGNEPNS